MENPNNCTHVIRLDAQDLPIGLREAFGLDGQPRAAIKLMAETTDEHIVDDDLTHEEQVQERKLRVVSVLVTVYLDKDEL